VHLVRTAEAAVQELTILVCTVEREPIPGDLRYTWMREIFPQARVVHVTDEVPSYPRESPDFEAIWTELLRRQVPGAEVFFSSEDYGDDVARWLGIEHVCVDPQRAVVPVSSTDIRDRPARHWELIPAPVRPYFVTVVALLGPESTGKSTLSRRLADHFATADVQEFARDAADWQDPGFVLAPRDIEDFCRGQARLIDEARNGANRLLFADTEAITSHVWSEIYFGHVPASVREAAAAQRFPLYLLLATDVAWVDDGTRSFGHLRERHFQMLREELERRGRPYAIVSGGWEERFRSAVASVEELL
jgi:NadR type nicotinamide-nucleotide adenylyltransferase